MFRRRSFRSGTLERSVRRFGRFPRFGRTGVQRKNIAHLYSNGTLQLSVAADPEVEALSLVSNAELQPAAGIATGAALTVRGISIDLIATLQVTPDLTGGVADFGSLYVHWALFKQDVDETITTFTAAVATNSLIKWGIWPVQAVAGNNSASVYANPTLVQQARMKFRVSKLEQDEELVFLAAWSQPESKTAELDACFIHLNQRVRYEVP